MTLVERTRCARIARSHDTVAHSDSVSKKSSGLDAHPLDAELLGELARAGCDAAADFCRLEHDGFAALREHFALEPLGGADRDLLQRAAVGKRTGAALDLEPRDLRRVQHACGSGIAQPRRLEVGARLELLLRQVRA